MNDILSEEQQQLVAIKNWILDNLISLIAAVILFCAVLFGPGLYESYKNSKIFPASDTYEQFNLAVIQASTGSVATETELQLVDNLADLLIEQYGDSHYAFLASLRAAKLSADLGNYEVAQSRLQWAEDATSNEADQQLVNYRLALIEAQLGDTDSALDRLGDSNEHFASLYAEARADIYSSQGRRDEAMLSYREALETMGEANPTQRNAVQLKLDALLKGPSSISK